MKTIKSILMKRDGLSEAEAEEMIFNAHADFEERLEEGDLLGASEICMDHFGLEPDYWHEFLL